jgi:phenylalanine-4-hydroxylase
MKQNFEAYTKEDKWVWKTLFERQKVNLQDKASSLYLKALNEMSPVLNVNNLPKFEALNSFFEASTEWQIEVVPGLIEVEDFFSLLAQKKFCSSTWLRSKDSLDYLEEPDMFHDIFGHIPLLSQPVFSDFVYEFGKLGKSARGNAVLLKELQRLYWFTIEFGVIREEGKIKSYGAGILSSYGETNQIHKGEANFLDFDVEEILQKVFRTDIMQTDYYVLKDFESLLTSTKNIQQLVAI